MKKITTLLILIICFSVPIVSCAADKAATKEPVASILPTDTELKLQRELLIERCKRREAETRFDLIQIENLAEELNTRAAATQPAPKK